jgi:hypothetical protein
VEVAVSTGLHDVHPPDATDEEWERFHTEELDTHKAIAQARWLIRMSAPTGRFHHRAHKRRRLATAVADSLRDVADTLRARIRRHAIRPDAANLVDYTRHQLAIVERLGSGHRA